MFGDNPPSHQSQSRVSFILLDGFALSSFALALETLSVVNFTVDTDLYQWSICSPDVVQVGDPVISNNQVSINTTSELSDCFSSDLVVLGSYRHAARYHNPELDTLLKRLHRRGITIASLSSGAFQLASAGLLSNGSCTLIPEHREMFAEIYPRITLQENLFTVSGNLVTSSGGTTSLDMMLYLIGIHHGRELIAVLADQFMQDRVRDHEEMIRTKRLLNIRIKSPSLGAAIEVMEQHLEEPYQISQIAHLIGTTPRNMETVFQKHTGMAPVQYYRQIRLKYAHKLLSETHLSINRVAQASGFPSQSYFTRRFRELFGYKPSEVRKKADHPKHDE